MLTITPYLNFDGKAEEAFLFYKSVFGGDFIGGIRRMADAPGMESLSAEDKNRVLHIALRISEQTILMASDTDPSMGHQHIPGNNIHLSIHPNNKEEADRIFSGLSQNGSVEMPLQNTFWNAYFGSCTDQFGIRWMINFSLTQAW